MGYMRHLIQFEVDGCPIGNDWGVRNSLNHCGAGGQGLSKLLEDAYFVGRGCLDLRKYDLKRCPVALEYRELD